MEGSTHNAVRPTPSGCKLLLTDEDLSPFDVGLRLNDTLLAVLGDFDGTSHCKPRGAVRALLNA